ncbi:hypothetical protein [Moraxella catarrhalis]|uniref:hypothetical protein n=1 Tax=Moraxella catarrhalis TaxID=480 RepID=UPI000202AAEC|nr:hypothetical protein [Moraxella catarrhalis]EGE10212.1 hypothetical protein E9M_08453 [Moraxella catarrhalis 46P47B1]MPW70639.1 hypothetical protein [Moraxella catarrhalis]MPW86953.1 hypothetical protein [Moraxella catarrhalis]MPX20456.1 hypothetical protein [Moraxella catarrhalis]MPX65704.1 hypothetical protein [Moraxella catarrhalis]
MITLDDLTDIDKADEQTVVIVNAWLNKHKIRAFDKTPDPIRQAGRYIAKAWLDGDLFVARTEGVVTSKSSKAGDVSVSKTYADGEQGQAMSQNEQIALALIEPYLQQPLGMFGLPLVRG